MKGDTILLIMLSSLLGVLMAFGIPKRKNRSADEYDGKRGAADRHQLYGQLELKNQLP